MTVSNAWLAVFDIVFHIVYRDNLRHSQTKVTTHNDDATGTDIADTDGLENG